MSLGGQGRSSLGLPRSAGAGQAAFGSRLFPLVTALDRQGERGGVPSTGLSGLARGEESFAEAVERLGLTRAIAGLAVEFQRLPEMADGLLASSLPQLGNAQTSQRVNLAQPAADLPAQPQEQPEMAGGLHIATLPQLEFAQVAKHKGLARPSADGTEERQ